MTAANFTGPFSYTSGQAANFGTSAGASAYNMTFNASKVSSLYQNDLGEVRPTNFSINYFIKY